MQKRVTPLVLLLAIVWLSACLVRERAPERDFAIEDLFIDESAFPAGWEVDASGPEPPPAAPLGSGCGAECMQLFFSGHYYGAHELIQRFSNVRGAVKEFKRLRDLDFRQGKYDTWVVPPELPYQSPVADQYHFACSTQGATPMCRALGQYDEYLISFSTHMAPHAMSYADLEHVLKAIDDRMAQYVKGNAR